MRIQCPQCNELFDALSGTVAGEAISITCTSCDKVLTLPVSKPSAGPSSEASPIPVDNAEGARCPKCDSSVQAGDRACSDCGLATERFADFTRDAGGDELEEAWLRLDENWASDDEHEAFMGHVASTGDFRGGAARYRGLEGDPSRGARSRQMLDRIQSMATAALLSSKPKIPDHKDEPFKKVLVLLLALMLLGAMAGVYVMFTKAKEKPQRQDTVPRTPQKVIKKSPEGQRAPATPTPSETP